MLKRAIKARNNQPATLRELGVALQEEWAAIPQDTIKKLIRSMRRLCVAVIAVNGGHSIY